MPEQSKDSHTSRLPEEKQPAGELASHGATKALSQAKCYEIMEGKVQQVGFFWLPT